MERLWACDMEKLMLTKRRAHGMRSATTELSDYSVTSVMAYHEGMLADRA
ncbi:hypothetical protein DY000_02028929 [Brassica cretica]|uniref:Uncharacterized protein n=1 Tax=Brassica cretica TaxID=69181 RepID=A0ABQ7DHH1_BRACR|nr:hypothetical protein DY000_02028929 [Brassica cretica]